MAAQKAIIAGATGAVGNAIATRLASDPDTTVVGLSRRQPAVFVPGVNYVQVDLDNRDNCRNALEPHLDATHVFYCGRVSHAEQTLENAAGNLRLLEHLIDTLEPGLLQHAHLVQGGKVYGVHIGPFPSPAYEDDPRAPIENFNYVQEDFLRARSTHSSWSWSASRPNTLVHYSPNNSRNLVSSIGAYATLCKELGAAFDFPGPETAYHSITQVTSLPLLADAMAWMATDNSCANQAFNVTNGDVFRWSQLWPVIAAFFDLPCGSVRPMRLANTMPIHASLWNAVVRRDGLQPLALEQVANWGYLDATLERTWDEILSTNKARHFGFHGWADTKQDVMTTFQRYRDSRTLP